MKMPTNFVEVYLDCTPWKNVKVKLADGISIKEVIDSAKKRLIPKCIKSSASYGLRLVAEVAVFFKKKERNVLELKKKF